MSSSILYIDGENLRHYLQMVLKSEHLDPTKPGLENFNYHLLFSSVLDSSRADKTIFYSAKLKVHPESLEKSKKLILKQRILKTNLEKQGIEFLISGNVRGQRITVGGKSTIAFKEKGVDVKIAVDLVSHACDGVVTKAYICSSDSDLQPAVSELKKRGVEVIYVGFELHPNKGMMFTADRAILIRNSEVAATYTEKL